MMMGNAAGGDRPGEQRVLVVEDDLALRLTIGGVLDDEGIPCDMAADGQQAIDRFSRARPTLVLLDMGLPVVDGYGVADRLRAIYGESVPIIVLTADGRAAEKARRVGAVDHLHKPFDIDDLIRIVRRFIHA